MRAEPMSLNMESPLRLYNALTFRHSFRFSTWSFRRESDLHSGSARARRSRSLQKPGDCSRAAWVCTCSSGWGAGDRIVLSVDSNVHLLYRGVGERSGCGIGKEIDSRFNQEA